MWSYVYTNFDMLILIHTAWAILWSMGPHEQGRSGGSIGQAGRRAGGSDEKAAQGLLQPCGLFPSTLIDLTVLGRFFNGSLIHRVGSLLSICVYHLICGAYAFLWLLVCLMHTWFVFRIHGVIMICMRCHVRMHVVYVSCLCSDVSCHIWYF